MYKWFKENKEDFSFQEFILNDGTEVVLVNPLSSFSNWNEDNKIYRSSIWTKKDGYPISLGFKKFTNLGEKPEFEPIDPSWIHAFYYEKLDGSCLIVSKYKDQLIIRTRGTFSVLSLKNGQEAIDLINNLNFSFKEGYSYLFEWCTPTNQIVVKYNEPKLYLTGIVEHSTYNYLTQDKVTDIALSANICRPEYYNFITNNPEDFYKKYLENNNTTEGVVIYFNNGQILKKLKTDWYCKFHSFRFNLGSKKYLLKLLWSNNLLDYSEDKDILKTKLFKFVEEQFDYEVAYYASVQATELIDDWDIFRKKVLFTQTKLKDISTPEEVCKILQEDKEIDQKLVWPIFRKKDFSLVTLQNYLLK